VDRRQRGVYARLDLAREGANQIAAALNLGNKLEKAQAAPNTRRHTYQYGSIIVALHTSGLCGRATSPHPQGAYHLMNSDKNTPGHDTVNLDSIPGSPTRTAQIRGQAEQIKLKKKARRLADVPRAALASGKARRSN
jgi:hypothetical protein